MASPSTDGGHDGPGQWIAQLVASGNGVDDDGEDVGSLFVSIGKVIAEGSLVGGFEERDIGEDVGGD